MATVSDGVQHFPGPDEPPTQHVNPSGSGRETGQSATGLTPSLASGATRFSACSVIGSAAGVDNGASIAPRAALGDGLIAMDFDIDALNNYELLWPPLDSAPSEPW